MIWVCPLSRLDETIVTTGARRLLTLLKHGTPFDRPASIAADQHLLLSMHDIVEEAPDMVAPARAHVESLIEFGRGWDRAAPLVVNCFAGISRSTASAYIIAAALAPTRGEAELARTLRRLSPSATPNIRLVALADDLLGRDGRMVEAVRSIGRGADAFEGAPFALSIDA